MIGVVKYTNIKHLIKDAQREGVVFAQNTLYFGYIDAENNILGIGGLLLFKNKVIIKGLYILPAYRRRGICKELLNYLIVFAISKNLRYAEATCTQASYYEFIKRGFKIKYKYQHYIKVCHENLSQAIRI